jgi:hypothetical protein
MITPRSIRSRRTATALALGAALCAAHPVVAQSTCANPAAIVADHAAVADVAHGAVPDHWIESARRLTLQWWGASHAHQALQGALILEKEDGARFPFACLEVGELDPGCTAAGSTPGVPPAESPAALRMYFGNPTPNGWDGAEGYWDAAPTYDSWDYTKQNNLASGGLFDASSFGWCNELQSSDYTADALRYVQRMADFESDPQLAALGERFIYQSGPGYADALASNEIIRAGACEKGKILFDYADIETHDPDGVGYPGVEGCLYWPGGVNWCKDWCQRNARGETVAPAGYCNLDIWSTSACAHSDTDAEGYDRLICKMKAQALWWTMARVAGWGGVPAGASHVTIGSADPDAGVAVAVTPPDIASLGSGTTPFERDYAGGTAVTLTAAATAGASRFVRWEADGRGARNGNERTITTTPDGDLALVARYTACDPHAVRADVDDSGRVDGFDLILLGRVFGTSVDDPADPPVSPRSWRIDINLDGFYDGNDLQLLAPVFAATCAP